MTLIWCSSKFAQLYKLSLCNKINIQPFLGLSIFLTEGWNTYNWRASEASDTLSGVYKFELGRYVYIYIAKKIFKNVKN